MNLPPWSGVVLVLGTVLWWNQIPKMSLGSILVVFAGLIALTVAAGAVLINLGVT